jgi:hypothetical protein
MWHRYPCRGAAHSEGGYERNRPFRFRSAANYTDGKKPFAVSGHATRVGAID